MNTPACAGLDPAIFDTDMPGWRDGLDVCVVVCPMRAQCLADTLAREGDLAREYRGMIFGGYTPAQRARISAGEPPGEARAAA